HELEASFEQALFGERVTDLDCGALFLDVIAELGRCHGRAANAITASLRAEINDREANAFGLGVENLVRVSETRCKRVDEDVAIVAAVELNFATHCRHAKRVAIAADASDNAGHQMFGLF